MIVMPMRTVSPQTIPGELAPVWPICSGRPMSPRMSTMPASPNSRSGLPVLASRETSWWVPVTSTIRCMPRCSQNSMPRCVKPPWVGVPRS